MVRQHGPDDANFWTILQSLSCTWNEISRSELLSIYYHLNKNLTWSSTCLSSSVNMLYSLSSSASSINYSINLDWIIANNLGVLVRMRMPWVNPFVLSRVEHSFFFNYGHLLLYDILTHRVICSTMCWKVVTVCSSQALLCKTSSYDLRTASASTTQW